MSLSGVLAPGTSEAVLQVLSHNSLRKAGVFNYTQRMNEFGDMTFLEFYDSMLGSVAHPQPKKAGLSSLF